MVMQPCKAKVAEPRLHVAVKKHIACLDVSMDDDAFPVLVEAEETRDNAFDDAKPLSPIEDRHSLVIQVAV
jgi:hypothetical protein